MKSAKVFATLVAVCLAPIPLAFGDSSQGNRNFNPAIQTIPLFQDFETPSGWNGANPPLGGWSIVDNAASDNVWDVYDWHDTTGWGGHVARVSGGSQNRYNNDWLISPAANFGSASACTLFFRHYYDDYATQAADSALVMLSSDGGATWPETVAVYTGSDYGSITIPDSEYFDISSFASGQSEIKAAFQYVKREAVLVASWRVDDFKFRADGALVLGQNFDGSWGPYGNNPPSGWSILDVHVARWDDNDWHQTNAPGWGNIAHVFWSPIEHQSEFLKSPIIDLTADSITITLSLKQWYDDQPDNRDTAFILGSIDAGLTWPETIAVYQGSDHGSASSPLHDMLDIASWARYQANTMLGFKYVGNNDGRWYIDSVQVETDNRLARDVAVTSILIPLDTTIQGYVSGVSAQVENVGRNPGTFNVFFIINDSTGATVYIDTQSVVGLQPLQQTNVTFANWIPSEANSHSITCYALLPFDLYRHNDSLQTMILTLPHVGGRGPVQGWSYRDNLTGGGSAFAWIDISSTGIPVDFPDADDGNSGMIDMGMAFQFFGTEYSRLAICTNGWLSFTDSVSTDNSNSAIPDPDGPSAMVALLWNDLHLRTGHVYYRHDPVQNRFIVQYDSVEYASEPGSDIMMEVIFEGNENTIKMQYLLFAGGPRSDITIGIENLAQDAGLAFNNNGEIGQVPVPELAIDFVYLLPDDIKGLTIVSPNVLVFSDSSYDIVAKFRNNGANMESFNITAQDDHGYSNTQNISNLGSLDTAVVTFSGWVINSECENYALTIYSELGTDLNLLNDTLSMSYFASPPANAEYVLDDGFVYAGLNSDDSTDILATRFKVLYSGATISSVSYRCFSGDEIPGSSDTIRAYIFLDQDDDGIPEVDPIYSKRVAVPQNGWTTTEIACDTTITLNCQYFWVGWSITSRPLRDTLITDRLLDFPSEKWARLLGSWGLLPGSDYGGDYMIRAYLDTDPATLPTIALGTTHVSGAAPPNGADTAGTYLHNIGIGCSDLEYTVTVLQTYNPQESFALPDTKEPEAFDKALPIRARNVRGRPDELQSNAADPAGPPQLLNSGGPDNYGYTWKDSDEPSGPIFAWTNLSSIGTEVTWSHGTSDDGWSNPIPLGMAFNLYGRVFQSVIICTNGWVSFLPQTSDHHDPRQIPSPEEPNALLAVEWGDLAQGAAGHCKYYYDNVANSFIIAWIDWSHHLTPSNLHEFEIIINGMDGTIVYQYRNGIFPSYISVGVESEFGTDGLQVAYNQSYLHNNLAILFEPPTFWLSTDLVGGALPPLSDQLDFNVFMNSTGLPAGAYDGAIMINSNDPVHPSVPLNVHFEVEASCAYIPGDVNGTGDANGIDVIFMVNFFKGESPPHEECPPCAGIGSNMQYPQGDVNGSCQWNGIDINYFVNYLKGIGQPLRFCDLCPPAGGLATRSMVKEKPRLSGE
jgi:hypothetical protein